MQERFVVHVTDVLAVSMMLGITAQVKEAGIAWDKGEKKSEEQGAGCLLWGALVVGRRPWVGEGGSALSVGLGREGRSCSSAPGVLGAFETAGSYSVRAESNRSQPGVALCWFACVGPGAFGLRLGWGPGQRCLGQPALGHY